MSPPLHVTFNPCPFARAETFFFSLAAFLLELYLSTFVSSPLSPPLFPSRAPLSSFFADLRFSPSAFPAMFFPIALAVLFCAWFAGLQSFPFPCWERHPLAEHDSANRDLHAGIPPFPGPSTQVSLPIGFEGIRLPQLFFLEYCSGNVLSL